MGVDGPQDALDGFKFVRAAVAAGRRRVGPLAREASVAGMAPAAAAAQPEQRRVLLLRLPTAAAAGRRARRPSGFPAGPCPDSVPPHCRAAAGQPGSTMTRSRGRLGGREAPPGPSERLGSFTRSIP